MLRAAPQHGSISSRNESTEEVPMVQVVSPATLCEGYEFAAKVGGRAFPVVVPSGGIKAGQSFLAPLPNDVFPECGSSYHHTASKSNAAMPVVATTTTYEYATSTLDSKGRGKWKDGLFSCFRHGVCHPHVWNAWLCPQVLMGQILARMKLKHWPFVQDSNDNNNRKQSTQKNTRKLIFFLVFLSVYDAWTTPPLIEFTIDQNGGIVIEQSRGAGTEAIDSTAPTSAFWHQLLYLFLTLPMTLYGMIVIIKLRAAVRDKYGIPTGRLGRMEDFMYACFCNCCILSQMARQTADYDDEPASCCSPNGMTTTSTRRHSNNFSTSTITTCSTESSDDMSSIHGGSV